MAYLTICVKVCVGVYHRPLETVGWGVVATTGCP